MCFSACFGNICVFFGKDVGLKIYEKFNVNVSGWFGPSNRSGSVQLRQQGLQLQHWWQIQLRSIAKMHSLLRCIFWIFFYVLDLFAWVHVFFSGWMTCWKQEPRALARIGRVLGGPPWRDGQRHHYWIQRSGWFCFYQCWKIIFLLFNTIPGWSCWQQKESPFWTWRGWRQEWFRPPILELYIILDSGY